MFIMKTAGRVAEVSSAQVLAESSAFIVPGGVINDIATAVFQAW